MRRSWLLLLSLLVMGLAGCGEPLATPGPVFLRAAGSTAMEPLVAELAEAFQDQHPLVNVEVSGRSTEYGVAALRNGEVDLALASWLPDPLDPGWRATAIARDGIAVIVHPSNPVAGLGLLQLQDLFSGRVYDWTGVGGRATQGPVQAVSREDGSGTRAAFETLVMDGRQVTPLAVLALSSQAVVDYVAAHPDAIGYVSMGYVSPAVRALAIEGERPTPQSASQGSYPLSRELWLVTADAPAAAVEDVVEFALSPAGQQIAGQRYGRIK